MHKIGGVALIGRNLDPGAGDHVVAAAPRQLPIVKVGGHREQHMTLGCIGVSARDQPFGHCDHLRDIFGRPRLDVGRQGAECRHILVKRRGRPRRQGRYRLVVLAGSRVDLVLDVGDVPYIAHVITPVDVAQQPVEHIEDNDRPAVADMCTVIDRRPADIEAYIRRIERFEPFLAAGKCVVERQRHG